MKRERHIYISGHTQVGFFSVLPELSKELEVLYVIKGLSKKKTDKFLKRIALEYSSYDLSIDYFHSPSQNEYIEGIRVNEHNIAMVEYELAKKLEKELLEQRTVIVNLEKVLEPAVLKENQKTVVLLQKERNFQVESAYNLFAEAKGFHQKKEDIYLQWMDFKKADAVCDKLIETLFCNSKENETQGNMEEIFFGAATPNGAVHFIEELTAGLQKRYIIKGRSGSGKSTLMRKVGDVAQNRGMDITYFLCGFDPSSVDMLIIEELGIAIIDGTSPHVIDPTRETDEVIDMFEHCIDPAVEEDEQRLAEIREVEEEYRSRMKKGTKHLQKADEIQKVIDEYYDNAVDEKLLAKMEREALKKVIITLD
ncbi:hypothetical protein [Bacillus sp. FJAT-45350]|uniref:hypothetical protein n=1 Tax=Bacillus sp. FJAT-45350 TaxID=2011014 RepID=UPI000BB6CD00|nr:hypothetical protein [Bacillus sp. FJAT-45350]